MAALQADTGKLGAPKGQGSDLYFGNTKVSPDVVDAVVKAHGGVATLFVKSGDQYVRVATTVKKEDGTSAVGTALDANSPAIAKLNNGEPYYGDATIFGKTYVAGYEPMKDATGAVIGAYFVGYPKLLRLRLVPNEAALDFYPFMPRPAGWRDALRAAT